MSTMNISLPDPLKDFVNQRVVSARYGSASEYVRELIRRDQERLHLRRLLMDGAESVVSGVADDQYFAGLREATHQRLDSGRSVS